MPKLITVRAVRGIAFPRAAPRAGFVGYEEAELEDEADHEVPSGRRYRMSQTDEQVPDSPYYRRALRQGDLQRADASLEEDES